MSTVPRSSSDWWSQLSFVNLLVDRLSLTELSPEQQKVVVRLQDLAEQANRAVKEYRSDGTAAPA